MSELAPIKTHEAFKPARSLELVENIEDPTTLRPEAGEESSRFQDIDEAHDVANIVDVQRDMLIEARQDLEKAYGNKKSVDLVPRYENRVISAKMGLDATLNITPRAQRREKRAAEDYDIAA
jgi:hypothetical protein